MVVSLRHSEPIDRIFFEIEFHQHGGLVAHHPPVVLRLDGDDLRSYKLQRAAVCVLNMDLAAGKEAYMGVHAEPGADDSLHVIGPAESGRIDYTLNATGSGAYDVELEAANVAVFALIEWSEEWISNIHEIPRGENCAEYLDTDGFYQGVWLAGDRLCLRAGGKLEQSCLRRGTVRSKSNPSRIDLGQKIAKYMDASVGRRSLRMVLVVAATYLLVGLTFAEFSGWATTNAMQLMWRRLAWLVSGVAFGAHICYGHFRLGNSPRTTAMQASIAAALGAGGLAVAANVHEWTATSRYRLSIALALVVWPLLTAIPAFTVAMVFAAVLNRWCRRS
jgi:hypothetical protein